MAHSGPKTPIPTPWRSTPANRPTRPPAPARFRSTRRRRYVFPDTDTAAALFNMETPGHVYSRLSNPTVAVFEERMAALEDGVGAIATASGQAALHLAIVTLMGQGGHIVASVEPVRRLAQPARLHPAPLRHRDHLRARRATSTRGGAPSGRKRGCSSARASATRRWTCSTFPRFRRSPAASTIPLLVDATVTTPAPARRSLAPGRATS